MTKEEIMHKAGSIVDGMISNYVPSEICNSYYQGFIEGATLADKTLIDKACKWLESTDIDMEYWNSEDGVCTELLIEGIKKAMEL